MKHQKIAQKWADEYPGQKNLPMHASSARERVAQALMRKRAAPAY